MEKIISLKIKLGVAKYKIYLLAQKNNFFWGSHGYLSLTLATAPGFVTTLS